MKTFLTSLACLLLFGTTVFTQPSASATAAKSLIQALESSGLEAIATIDPTEPGAFIAALHIKGGQLLVVRAHHPSADAVNARLAAAQYRDVYIDLQATPAMKGKWFLMDTGADGLPAPSEDAANVDVLYEDGTTQTMFNGARAQKMSDAAYAQKLKDADAHYARLLQVLIAAAQNTERP